MLEEIIRDLLANFEEELPERPTQPSPADLRPWRDRIDILDRAIVQMLNERSICANVIGEIKKKLDVPVYVPGREDEVLRNVAENNAGPLPEGAVRRIFERIIDETRSLERQRYQHDNPS